MRRGSEEIIAYARKVSRVRPNKVQEKAKANLAELNAAPIDRKRGLYTLGPTRRWRSRTFADWGRCCVRGWRSGVPARVGRVAGNLAAVPSVFDRALDDVAIIVSDGPMEARRPFARASRSLPGSGCSTRRRPTVARRCFLVSPMIFGRPARCRPATRRRSRRRTSGERCRTRRGTPTCSRGTLRRWASRSLAVRSVAAGPQRLRAG